MTFSTLLLLIITTIGLWKADSVTKLVRIYLLNFLVAGIVVAVIQLCFIFTAVALHFTPSPIPTPPLGFCRFISWVFSVAAVTRVYSLMAFAVIVLLIVKYSIKDMKNGFIVLTLILIWFIPTLLSTHVLVPRIFSLRYYDNVLCFAGEMDESIIKEARYSFTAIWVTGGGIIPMFVSTVITIAVLHYVKLNTISGQGSSYNKGMAKFALFLVFGNLINIIILFAVAITYYFSMKASAYLLWCIFPLLTAPSPVLVIIFFKPIRDKFCLFVCYCCHHPQHIRMAVGKLDHQLIERNQL